MIIYMNMMHGAVFMLPLGSHDVASVLLLVIGSERAQPFCLYRTLAYSPCTPKIVIIKLNPAPSLHPKNICYCPPRINPAGLLALSCTSKRTTAYTNVCVLVYVCDFLCVYIHIYIYIYIYIYACGCRCLGECVCLRACAHVCVCQTTQKIPN